MGYAWLPDFLKNLDTANYGMWNAPDPAVHPDGSITAGEGGVDIGTPIGTPVYAIATGPIQAAGYWKDNAHGVVTQRVNVPGAGPQDLYYQHIQLDPSIKQCQGSACTGQMVQKGQRIGTIGPFNEIEMGFNAKWGGVWGDNHPGPWVSDPRPWIKALLGGPDVPVTTSGSSGLPLGLDTIMPTIKVWGEYVAIFLIAIVLVMVGFFLLSGQTPVSLARKVV